MQDLHHFVNENCQKTLVANGQVFVCLHTRLVEARNIVKCEGEQAEKRGYQLCCLYKETSQLAVTLEGFEDKFND